MTDKSKCDCKCCKHRTANCEHGYTEGHKWAYREKGTGSMIPHWCSGPK